MAEKAAAFVAAQDDGFVGVADGYVAEDGRGAEVGGMWVSPERRGSGIGQALLVAVCEWARGRGAAEVGLWVREANAPAIRLYAGAGFAVVERRTTAEGRTGFRMEKLL